MAWGDMQTGQQIVPNLSLDHIHANYDVVSYSLTMEERPPDMKGISQ